MTEELLARLVEEYHRRQVRGERPKPEDFREEAGDGYEELVELLRQEEHFDRLVEDGAGERLPRMFGEYTLVEFLGRGGCSEVYKAMQRSLSRPVALKVLQGGWAEDQRTLERFRRGARAAAQVEHDHAIRIYDSGVFEGRGYLAMSLVDGPTFTKVLAALREAGPPPFGPKHHAVLDAAGIPGGGADTGAYVRRMAALLAGPAEALETYHARGIVHRDVKPGNLLLGPHARLIVTDFDLVKSHDTSFRTAAGSLLGTPHYMSPEQWDPNAAEVDARADVYALGAVLYETLTLRRAFDEQDPGRLMHRVLRERPPDPRRATPDLPLDAQRVVMKALEKRPQDRYPSAGGMAADLRRLAGREPVVARPVPVPTKAARWLWARRVAAAATVLLAVAGGLWWNLRPGDLHVLPWPGGHVFVDGRLVGEAPIRALSLSPGRYWVRVRMEGFVDHEESVELEAGDSRSLSPVLRAVDPLDPRVLEIYEERLGIDLWTGKPPATRASEGPEGPFLLLLPRGRVRKGDLARFVAELGAVQDGRLVVTCDGEEIWGEPVQGKHVSFEHDIPEDLLRALEEGRTYEWGFDRGSASFEVVPDVAAGTLEELRARLHPDDARAARLFEIALLQREGLHMAAARAAARLAEEWPRREVFALAWRSLAELGLEKSAAAEALRAAYVEAR